MSIFESASSTLSLLASLSGHFSALHPSPTHSFPCWSSGACSVPSGRCGFSSKAKVLHEMHLPVKGQFRQQLAWPTPDRYFLWTPCVASQGFYGEFHGDAQCVSFSLSQLIPSPCSIQSAPAWLLATVHCDSQYLPVWLCRFGAAVCYMTKNL